MIITMVIPRNTNEAVIDEFIYLFCRCSFPTILQALLTSRALIQVLFPSFGVGNEMV